MIELMNESEYKANKEIYDGKESFDKINKRFNDYYNQRMNNKIQEQIGAFKQTYHKKYIALVIVFITGWVAFGLSWGTIVVRHIALANAEASNAQEIKTEKQYSDYLRDRLVKNGIDPDPEWRKIYEKAKWNKMRDNGEIK